MSEHAEPIVTAEQRDCFRAYVDDARALLRDKFTMSGQPVSARSRWTAVTWDVLFAVADRFAWLEAERERLYASDETNQERVMHVLDIVDGLKNEREKLVRERDEARTGVEQMHARADRATAELLALGRELKQARGRITEWQQTCQDWIDNGVSKADMVAFLFDDARIDAGWPRG